MAFLYRIRPDGTAVERWEAGEEPLVLGRGECANAFVDDDALSRSHFLVVSQGADFYLIDLNSSNGTWLGNKRVSARKLGGGDIILAGKSLFGFSIEPSTNFILPTAVLPVVDSMDLAGRT